MNTFLKLRQFNWAIRNFRSEPQCQRGLLEAHPECPASVH